MHELSVCQALLDQVVEIAAEHGGVRVSCITIRVGPLSGIEPQLLSRAFEVVCSGSIAAGTELNIEPEAVRIYCPACDRENPAAVNQLRCRQCSHVPVQLISGDALTLVSLSIERPVRNDPLRNDCLSTCNGVASYV